MTDAEVDRAKRLLSAAYPVRLPGVSHTLFTHPEEVARELTRFFRALVRP